MSVISDRRKASLLHLHCEKRKDFAMFDGLTIEEHIRALARQQGAKLQGQFERRDKELLADDKSHYLLYGALGISRNDADNIDRMQNRGRFLYNHIGTFVDKAVRSCFKHAYPDAKMFRVINPAGGRPKSFEIDCLVGEDAHEIKWRDATTDGDHVIKEHLRARTIREAGYRPVRIMLFSPNRKQAMRIQDAIATLYMGIGGAFYRDEEAWEYIHDRTGVDLKGIIESIYKEQQK
jgi:hypothetical protein